MTWGNLHSFPKAIVHIDGDAFFASCEQALNPKLRGKPVITGKERGIVSAASYEAKKFGVKRGVPLWEVKKLCPEAVILPSDYETYSLFSKRMFAIVRRYTPEVEEYSIDECFADLTGLRRSLRMSYPEMAFRIKTDLERELGMTFSVGLGPNKVIAKVGSKWSKPSGFVIIPSRDIPLYTGKLDPEKIWGIGPNTAAYIQKLFKPELCRWAPSAAADGAHLQQQLVSALDFAKKPISWVKEYFAKPIQEIHRELNGEFVYPLNLTEKHDYQSISKTKTFTPPSDEREFVFSQLSKNIENACIKARRHFLEARELMIFLKTQDFHYQSAEIKLTKKTALPHVLVELSRKAFDELFRPGCLYRATGAVLMKLEEKGEIQEDLFGESVKAEEVNKVYEAIDKLDSKFGKHTVFLGSSFKAMKMPAHLGERAVTEKRRQKFLKGETHRQRLSIPSLGEVN